MPQTFLSSTEATASFKTTFFAAGSSASATASMPRFWVVSGGVIVSTGGALGDATTLGELNAAAILLIAGAIVPAAVE
jgi:hypothetical protein